MSRLLFTTLPSNDLGLLARALPVAVELAQHRHTIAFCSPSPAPRKLIAEAGFDNLSLKHPMYAVIAETLDWQGARRILRLARRDFGGVLNFARQTIRALPKFAPGTPEVWNLDHFAALSGFLSEAFVRASCDALITLLDEYRADVIIDAWNPFACIAARVVRKPLVTLIQADVHPASRGFIWWKDPPPDLPTAVPAVNRVLAAYHLPPISTMGELFVGDLTLVLGMPETDPLPEQANATYIGPIVWQNLNVQLPSWFDELRNDKPVVWVYSGNPRYLPVGSFWADSSVLIRACIDALADEDVQVVLTTGHHALPKEFVPLPDNFRHVPFVPGLAMAKRSDVLIHHGGYGSCQIGLCTGTPAVIIPTYSERESNARRVAAVGAGEFIVPIESARHKKHVCVDELRAKVKQVLADPAYTANARRISDKMQTYGGAAEASRLIEDLARETSEPQRSS